MSISLNSADKQEKTAQMFCNFLASSGIIEDKDSECFAAVLTSEETGRQSYSTNPQQWQGFVCDSELLNFIISRIADGDDLLCCRYNGYIITARELNSCFGDGGYLLLVIRDRPEITVCAAESFSLIILSLFEQFYAMFEQDGLCAAFSSEPAAWSLN